MEIPGWEDGKWPLIRLRGEPNGHLPAPVGALCAEVRPDGEAVLWVKRSGADAYGWERS
jgi:hypothetical protein